MKHNKNLRDNLISLALFVTLATAFYFIYWPKIVEQYEADWQPVQASLAIAELSSQIEFLSEYQNTNIRDIVLEDGVAYIGGSLDVSNPIALFSLNPYIQQINWQVRPSAHVITLDANNVYVISNSDVIAYKKISGEKVWEAEVPWPGAIDSLTVIPFGLFIETNNHGEKRWHLIDLETGKRVRTFKTEVEKNDFLSQNGLPVFVTGFNNAIEAQGVTKWQTSVDFQSQAGSFVENQLIVTDHIIIAYKEGDPLNQISALNRTNGNILWHIDEHIKSNLVEDRDILFFVTTDALIGADIITGQTTRYITFSPGIQEDHGYNSDAKLAVDNGQILIYFNSSKQLFIFRANDN